MDFLDRLRGRDSHIVAPTAEQPTVVQIDATALSRVFSAPMWLRDLGLLSWFLVGVGLVLVGAVWLIGLTSTITEPVLVGAILATVAGPLVSRMKRRGVPRAAGAALVLLALLALGAIIALLVFGGIYENSAEIKQSLSTAVDKVEGWVNDAGAGGTSSTTSDAKSGASTTGESLLEGVVSGIQGITSLVFFLTFAIFSTFFLLKDGPAVRAFIDRNLGVPVVVATTITSNVIVSLRRYFLGVTIVAAFNAVVVGIGAYLLDVPLAGTIAVVTFVTAYVPYIGAVVAGTFAVLIALGGQGTGVAVAMLVVVLLANGLLQNIVQPFAMGSALHLNPLVVLVVTIGAGCLFGMLGLVLAAPLVSAAVRVTKALDQLSEEAAEPAPPEAAQGDTLIQTG